MTAHAVRQTEKERLLTITRLQELFIYNESNGIFYRRKSNQIAGRLSGAGYIQICIDYRLFYAHRLAWFYITETWPPNQIDHINGIKTDNRFSNLRLATRRQNQGNRPTNRNNKCGVKGVRWFTKLQKWQARLTVAGKGIHLGYFDTIEEASNAYVNASEKYFQEFARKQ